MANRTIESVIRQVSDAFPVLLLTGMRQVGKSWVLQRLADANRRYITLDDMKARELAKHDPARFIQENPPPVTIDEVQYATELFPYIKIWCDMHPGSGHFWLTGSQKFRLMEGVRESLAGRVAILNLLGFSQRETAGNAFTGKPFLPSVELPLAPPYPPPVPTSPDVFTQIWLGAFPRLAAHEGPVPPLVRKVFYDSYVQTYIERDVRDFYHIENALAFHTFLIAVAARTGQLLNYSDLARDAHIDMRTAKLWLDILRRSCLVELLYPYGSNTVSRLVKTPKVFFLDTGLAAHLCSWDSPDSLRNGAQSGHLFETHVFCEILKSYWHNGESPEIFFYRDTDQNEIDFVIERNRTLFPVEVKKTANPRSDDCKTFRKLATFKKEVGTGAVVCLYEKCSSFPNRDAVMVPVWTI